MLAGRPEDGAGDRRPTTRSDPDERGGAGEGARSDAFWEDFDKDPLGSLEFLENRIAPQAADGDLLFLRYVGTDLDAFQKTFDRMEIVDGTPVPEGQRGFLLVQVLLRGPSS